MNPTKIILILIISWLGMLDIVIAQTEADSAQAAKVYSVGMKLMRKRQYNQAIEQFETALKLFSEKNDIGYSQTLARIGYVYSLIPKYEKAIEYFERAEPFAIAVKVKHGEYKPIISLQVQLAYTYLDQRRFEKALPHFEEAKKLIKEDSTSLTKNQRNYQLSFVSGSIGRIFVKRGEFDKGVIHLDSASIYAGKTKNTDAIISALNRNSSYHLELGNIQKAKELNQKIIELATKKYGTNAIEMAVIYGLQGRLEQADQEYEQAKKWATKALEIHEQHPTLKQNNHAYNFYTLSVTENNIGEYDQALKHVSQAISKYKEIKMNQTFLMPVYSEKLKSLTYLKRFEEAGELVGIFNSVLEEPEMAPLEKSNTLLAVAIYLREKKEYQKAEKVYQQIIDLLSEDFSNKNSPLANVYYEYSIQSHRLGNYQKALKLIGQAIENNKTAILTKGKTRKRVISGINHIQYLLHKSDIVQSENNAIALQNALSTLDEGLEFVNFKRARSVGTKFSFESIIKLRNKALHICYELYTKTQNPIYITQALEYGEMAKSQKLKEWLYQAEEVTDFSDSSLHQKQFIEEKILLYQNLIESSSEKDSVQIANRNRYTDSLLTYQQKHFEILDNLKTSNPQYYQTMYQEISASEKQPSEMIEGDEQVIAFQETDSCLYALLLGEKNQMVKIPSFNLNQLTKKFREQLSNADDEMFAETSKILYQNLIKPIEPYLYAKKMRIINDGVLAYLPFELLLSDDEKYWYEDRVISYTYSLESFQLKADRSADSKEMIAFAPDFKGEGFASPGDIVRGELAQLTGTFEEISTLEKIYPGQYFTKENATEENFKTRADNFGLIHLATHAIVDDEEFDRSKLVFTIENDTLNDGYLHAYEIYNLHLNADIVTLSACNTGFGKVKKGEGVMSLSRAFAYAGVPATVVSLWPASDKSTPKIMKFFYKNLKEGQTKDAALANAKRQYLKTAIGKAKHPFYWGGFVLIGDDTPIVQKNNWWLWLSLVAFLGLAIMLFIRMKRRTIASH